MCQLTLLHGNSNLVKAILGNLTLSNSVGNKDGHGIYFPPPIKKFYKTEEDGGDKVFTNKYWEMIDRCVGDLDEVCLISHVRSASQTQKIINVENAHPHQVGNIILMHNGTLEPDDDKLEVNERIDSYWFTKRLSEVCGRKYLKPAHIAETMEDFRGKFAFLIADLRQPKIIYVVRGRLADLEYTNFKNEAGENVCFAINTSEKNLGNMVLPMFWRASTGEKLHVDKPKELDTESIYIYDIPSGSLTKTDQEIKERSIHSKSTSTVINRGTTHQHGRSRNWRNNSYQPVVSAATDDKSIFEMSKLAREMVLSFSELNYLYFLMFGSSILFMDSATLKVFHPFLEKLMKTYEGNGKGKKEKLWRETYIQYATKVETPVYLEIYDLAPKMRFPWFLNANSGLKKYVRPCIQKWNPDG